MRAFVGRVSAFGAGGRGIEGVTGGRVDDALLGEALVMRGLRPLSRSARLAMVVAAEVCPPGTPAGPRSAIVFGSAWSSLGPLADFVQVAAELGSDRVFPMAFPNTVVSVHAGYVATLLGITGPTVSVCGEHAGLEAVVEAVSLLRSGRADRVLAVASDAAEPVVAAARPMAGEASAGVRLTRDREDEGCLAVVTGCWVAAEPDGLPDGVRAMAVESPPSGLDCGAATGAIAFIRAVEAVARLGEPLVVMGRSGVRGVAALRLEPAGPD
jgi:Beta-ketoacyl synthase, N-terminal domain